LFDGFDDKSKLNNVPKPLTPPESVVPYNIPFS